VKKEENMKHKLGDAIERVGQKLSDVGASKIGKAVYNAGNKLEHSDDSDKFNSKSTSVDTEPKGY